MLKYGKISDTPIDSIIAELPYSTVLSAKSGRFLTKNKTSDRFAVTTATDTQIDGFTESNLTANASGAYTKVPIELPNYESSYEIPYYDTDDGVLTQDKLDALIGEVCDIYVASNIQYANASGTTYKVLIIVGGNVANNTLYVKQNPYPANARA